MNRGDGTLYRELASMRARMVLIILGAAVPLLLMAVYITVQNYRATYAQSLEQAEIVRAAEAARFTTMLAGVNRALGLLAQAPSVVAAVSGSTDPAGAAICDAFLRRVEIVDPHRYQALAVTDAAGRAVCSAAEGTSADAIAAWLDQTPHQPWYARAAANLRPGAGPPIAQRPAGAPALPMLYPVVADGHFAGAVQSLIDLTPIDSDRVAAADLGSAAGEPTGAPMWLIDPAGQPIGARGADSVALPPAGVVRPLLQRGRAINARARSGAAYAYAATALAPELWLLVGYRVSAAESAARSTLLLRIAALTVLALLALAAVLVGGHHAVVAPVKRLEAAVRRWRSGGGFDPGVPAGLPTELRDLAAAFAEASDTLAQREAQLRGALAQQELLMQEIHHRVKNNLQIIASLLNLQASRIRVPQARAEFQSARDRVRTLATLHRYLYSHGEVQTINMGRFLIELCGQLFEAMGETVGERIQLTIEATELRMNSDQAVPLSLVVTEVVGNALKYAFPDGRPGRISIRLTANEAEAELTIADDGVGLPRDVEVQPPQGGIGLQLIRGFVRQLRATLAIDETHGTSYCLRLPLHRDRLTEAEGAEG